MIASLILVCAIGILLVYLLVPDLIRTPLKILGFLFTGLLGLAWFGWILWLMVQATIFFRRVN